MEYLKPLEYSNQRILTTEQLAEAYEVETRRISENFNANKERYLEGKHYYFLEGEELRSFRDLYGNSVVVDRTPKLYLWTERGAALHAKSLNSDKAWELYEGLLDHYFRTRESISAIRSLETCIALLEQAQDRIALLEQTVYGMMAIGEDEQLQLQAKNTVELFLKQSMHPYAGNIATLHDIYALYVRWCNLPENNFKPMNRICIESALKNRYLLRNKKGLRNIVTDFEFRI